MYRVTGTSIVARTLLPPGWDCILKATEENHSLWIQYCCFTGRVDRKKSTKCSKIWLLTQKNSEYLIRAPRASMYCRRRPPWSLRGYDYHTASSAAHNLPAPPGESVWNM
ncbi:unnamed protein product [Danaus chrysippus]|uniref:(African queen) hypothetical protein n=1 Tax=Danaus chrysippus TaxID=151541 RepID=A0A8J2W2L2_9NEOP|nr:unnamed protein product [Danaus chrysippus]